MVPDFFWHLADFVMNVVISPETMYLRGVLLTHLLYDLSRTVLHLHIASVTQYM